MSEVKADFVSVRRKVICKMIVSVLDYTFTALENIKSKPTTY